MKKTPLQTDDRRSTRRGIFSLELALTLPILGVVLLGLFEFSLLFFARGSVVEASRVAARTASLPGVGPEAVERSVRNVLSSRLRRGMKIRMNLGEQTGDVVVVGIRVPMRMAAPDLLWPIGVGLAGRDLYSETRMIKE